MDAANLISTFNSDLLSLIQMNSLPTYIAAALAIVLGLVAVGIVKKIISSVVKKPFISANPRLTPKYVHAVQRRLGSFLIILPFYAAVGLLTMPDDLQRFFDIIFLCLLLFTGIKLLSALIALLIDFALRGGHSSIDPATGKAIMPIARTVLWAVALTFLLDNLGFKISTIIAGLGVMGVAVGLAGQAILSDFFSHLVILIDKPFKIGDFIQITADGISGTVERIGLRTSVIRTANGEKLICNNSTLTKGIVANFNDIAQRRVRLLFPLAFNQSPAKIEAAGQAVQELISSYSECNFLRAVLLDFGPIAMNFEIVYDVKMGDLGAVLKVQNEINLKILKYFEDEQIGFATPPLVPTKA